MDKTAVGFAIEKMSGTRIYTWIEFEKDDGVYENCTTRYSSGESDASIFAGGSGTLKQCVERLIERLDTALSVGDKIIDAWIGDNWDGEPVGFEVVEKGFGAGDEFEVGWREWLTAEKGRVMLMMFNARYDLQSVWIRSTRHNDLAEKMNDLRKKFLVEIGG